MKKVVSFALAVMMAFTAIMVGGVEEAKADDVTYTEVTLADASFDDFWNNWSYDASDFVDGEAWPATSKAENSTVEFWRGQATEAWIYAKSGVTLEAGTYRMSVSAKASNDIGVRFALGGNNKSDVVAMASSDYATYSAELTLAEAGEVWIGFDILVDINKEDNITEGWTVIDKITLEKVTTTSSNPNPPAEITYTYDVAIVQEDKTVSDVSTADGVGATGEDVVFTAKIKKTGSDGSVVDVTELGELHLYWYDKTADVTTADTLTFTVNKSEAGEYWFDVTLQDAEWKEKDKTWFGIVVTDTASEGGNTTTPEGGNTTTPEGGNTTTPSDDKNTTEKEEEKVVVFDVPLQNADFEKEIGDPDDIWTGYLESGADNWDKTGFDELNYAEDEPSLEKPASHGAQCLKFNVESGEGLVVRQWIDKLPAGTYTITAPVMGADAKVSFVLGEYGETLMESGAVQLSGWNKWDTVKATFVVEEDMYNVQIGLKFVGNGSADGWGFVDNIKMQGGVPTTGDTTNAYAYVILMMAGLAIVGYSVKRNKVQF